MAKKQGDLSKQSSKSIRSNQRRTPSSSRSSCSSKSSSIKPAKKESRVISDKKIIYEPEKVVVFEEQSPYSRQTINVSQGVATVGVMIAWIYHLIWGSEPVIGMMMLKALMLELVACFLLIHVHKNDYTGSCCTFLTYQYFLLFSSFSSFLQADRSIDSSFFGFIFGLINVTVAVSCLHLIIVLQCMSMIGQSVKRNDYSNRVIVESKEKRRSDLFMMISNLMSNVTAGPEELEVDLIVADETGTPISMHDRNLDATTDFSTQLQIRPNDIELTTVKSAGASISAPRKPYSISDSDEKVVKEPIVLVNNSIYNKCKKQEKMLSPRKVL